jgi:hypothetical protein
LDTPENVVLAIVGNSENLPRGYVLLGSYLLRVSPLNGDRPAELWRGERWQSIGLTSAEVLDMEDVKLLSAPTVQSFGSRPGDGPATSSR